MKTANALAHRKPPDRVHSDLTETQRGRDAVAHAVSKSRGDSEPFPRFVLPFILSLSRRPSHCAVSSFFLWNCASRTSRLSLMHQSALVMKTLLGSPI